MSFRIHLQYVDEVEGIYIAMNINLETNEIYLAPMMRIIQHLVMGDDSIEHVER